jgi:hypothetical protein
MKPALSAKTAPASDGALVTKAVLRAAGRLGVSNRALSRILGVSEASVSRMGSCAFVLAPRDKSYELGLLFLRLFRSLDAIVGGDDAAARGWIESENAVLGGIPAGQIESLAGLINVVGYLDARRALV